VAPARGCIASWPSIRAMEAPERFKDGHDMPTADAPQWLVKPATWRTGSFPRAGCVELNVRGAAWRGWVFSM
ncbi:hypothetical protein BDU57DRAFT_460787, partial [Ampelomyces quisqualis]